MSGLRVLVSGASIAGPALAYWLVRAGCRVTVVERAPSLRIVGQGVDVRHTARDVIRRMGIFDRIRELSSHEEGMEFVDSNNRVLARFGVDESGNGDSLTSDVEIMRGELAKILIDATKNDVEYIFGDMVESLEETDKEVRVHFARGTPTKAFDLVVAADGIGSKIRGLALGDESVHVRSLNAYVAYFSIPRTDSDTMCSRVHTVGKGRQMVLRPDNQGQMKAFLSLVCYENTDERLRQLGKASEEDVAVQKGVIRELFEDADWEVARMVKGMHEADDFYLQYIGQVKLDHWSKGRVALVGDAAYCPSPFTGMGTSLAFLGAYILAGEISRRPNDIPAALASYESYLRPYVEKIQKLPPGIPWIANPQSKLGVRLLETFVWTASMLAGTGFFTLLSKAAGWFSLGHKGLPLPQYEAFKK